ncbi:MAG: hypothetical protein IAG10_02145 [Planctomycetaceae bacterium]|nr:hypothetical protein [Planctomycetaceae bacterium]
MMPAYQSPSTIERRVVRRRVLLPDVIAAMVAEFGVLADVLTVAGRHVARDAAIWLSRELSACSLDEVSAAFGGVTRSAVTGPADCALDSLNQRRHF